MSASASSPGSGLHDLAALVGQREPERQPDALVVLDEQQPVAGAGVDPSTWS